MCFSWPDIEAIISLFKLNNIVPTSMNYASPMDMDVYRLVPLMDDLIVNIVSYPCRLPLNWLRFGWKRTVLIFTE